MTDQYMANIYRTEARRRRHQPQFRALLLRWARARRARRAGQIDLFEDVVMIAHLARVAPEEAESLPLCLCAFFQGS